MNSPSDKQYDVITISRQSTLDQGAAWLRDRRASLVAIKQGAEGASDYHERGQNRLAVMPVTGGDSIGAGDSFDAGFLAGWLRNLPADRCLDIACRCSRSVASAVGGLEGQLTWEKS
jgi:sugar/nucleoside kinase (ribokinase family)